MTASGSTGLMYQWYKNQRSIHNATNSTYTINNIGLTGAGSYFCIVSNECALIQSDVAVITVGSSVAITEQPVGFEECVGTEVQFSLTATGTSPSYQWYKNGILIPLATNRTYGIQSIALFDAGNYKCIVSGCNTIESDVVSLTVNTPPEITAQTEQDAHTCPGISKELFVTATGKDLSYQWYNTSGIMIDENLSTLNTDIADSYYCIVSGTCAPNTTTSLEITLSIDSAPSIEITATSHVKYAEDSIVYTVEPSGTAPFYYQWKKDNIDLPGATNSTLELNPILFGDAGIYSVNISNACGNEPTPVIDTLTVINKFTVDGTLTYDNLASTPITNTKLYLIKNVIEEEDVRYPFPPPSGSIDSTITDISGHFVFNHVIAGRYRIIPVITKPWGGSNPTDALIVNRNYIGLYTFIDDLKERAADVSSDTIIEPLDALLINQRYVRKIKTFPGADWLYSGDVFEVTDSMTYDIKAICTGDANGSYVPGLRYEYVDFNKEGNIVVKPGEMFNMPLIIGKDVDLGAIGLKIKYSGVKVYDVISDIKGLVYNIEDNNVYIAWTSTPNNSVNLKAGDQFIYLKCMLINNVTDLDNIFILSSESKLAYNSSESELADNSSESELADNNINEINEQIINMPKLQQVQVSNAEFSFGSYPNPFTSITTITYYLPEACDVTITVNNLLGQEMQTLVSEQKDKGLYNVTFDAGSLAKGVYSYRISAGSNTGTGKLLLVK